MFLVILKRILCFVFVDDNVNVGCSLLDYVIGLVFSL